MVISCGCRRLRARLTCSRPVERSHVDITDISLVTLTAQFLDFVASLESQEPSLLAEFSSVGSRLVVLKSRSLLPRPRGRGR